MIRSTVTTALPPTAHCAASAVTALCSGSLPQYVFDYRTVKVHLINPMKIMFIMIIYWYSQIKMQRTPALHPIRTI
ncbi:hypothetical protein N7447_007845 [Penicillium robsamsonii]|uniref:uncharacterized protein n=1 Tax=Penicillium robsamsonii TaxID=1792511 RepID=UPI0025487FD3|nr:uncharacterized protein N7447_007845 [Penicillium robsamsonii]KAJ5817837.1 hypothetical protein N7447_007845 [Penicillium robsamsonii]